ncbi:MAG: undecaprenyl/decaprenyl-phosphate alpha-N-acetylglucosaminyl 1-phosphate transferase [Magnetococcales bacterium]|nr:undecaprenyl/decaprenyl-phosphate alpha-N-acetylglucosaminyl 1-phosphate transferase [Magnetococcales bacterium]
MNAPGEPSIAILLAFGASWAWLGLLRPLAPAMGLLDRPGGRKQHSHPTPMVGGIAMFLSFWPGVFLLDLPPTPIQRLFLVTLLVIVIGAWDDARKLRVRHRIAAELVTGLLLCAGGGVTVVTLGNLLGLGTLDLGILAVPFSVVCFIGVINAVNMADGIDGLAAGTCLVSTIIMLTLSWWRHRFAEAWILALLVAALIPFFCLNARLFTNKALVFLGDAGSLFLGTTMAFFTMTLSQGENPAFKPVVALWLIAVPLIDMFASFLRRLLAGRSPFSPDRHHAHHLLRQLKFSEKSATGILMATTFTLAILGVVLEHLGVPEVLMFLSLLLLYALYCAFTIHFWQRHV